MGAPNPQTKQVVRDVRRKETPMGDPLNNETRKAQDLNGCIYVNVTEYAGRTLGIETGDKVEVATYPDRVVIRKPGNVE